MKPFLKWAGGKSWLAERVLALFPEADLRTYHETFLGAGAVALRVLETRRMSLSLSDANAELMNVWQVVRGAPENLIAQLQVLESNHSEEWYYWLRAVGFDNRVLAAARTLYLNRAGFNGLYRVNRAGEFNVPWGKRARVSFDYENIRQVSRALRDVSLRVSDWRDALRLAQPGDLVYLDPPYVPQGVQGFTAYTKDGFSMQDHVDLALEFGWAKHCGVHVILSNSDTPVVRELYAGHRIIEVQRSGRMNSDGGKRQPVPELLIL